MRTRDFEGERRGTNLEINVIAQSECHWSMLARECDGIN